MRPKKIDGHDDAVAGIAWIGSTPVVIYDEDKLREGIMQRQGLTRDEAQEHIDFNIDGSLGYPLEGWPVLMKSATMEEIDAMEFEDD